MGKKRKKEKIQMKLNLDSFPLVASSFCHLAEFKMKPQRGSTTGDEMDSEIFSFTAMFYMPCWVRGGGALRLEAVFFSVSLPLNESLFPLFPPIMNNGNLSYAGRL